MKGSGATLMRKDVERLIRPARRDLANSRNSSG
jgi:hypothetical protein